MRVKIFLGIFAVSSCLSMVPLGNAVNICPVDPDLRGLQGSQCNLNQSDQIVSNRENFLVREFLPPVLKSLETKNLYATPEAFQSYFLNIYDYTKFAKDVLFNLKKGSGYLALETLSLKNLTSSQRNFVLDNMGYFFNSTAVPLLSGGFDSLLSTFKIHLLQSKFFDVKALLSNNDQSFFRRVWNSIKGAVYYMGAPGDLNMGYYFMKRDVID